MGKRQQATGTMRAGFTTGSCAAAAAKGAAILLAAGIVPQEVEIGLPGGEERICLPLLYARKEGEGTGAAVRKDAGDDPDITDGVVVVASLSWQEGETILIAGGEGVGKVTKPGLSVAPGQGAINPVPRRMIEDSLREVTGRGMMVVISIPGGEALAARTFNPRLGIEGGLSILGTSGRVRPFSCPALRASLQCLLDVAVAAGVAAPAFVPGHIGARAAKRHFHLEQNQIVEIGNEWGFMVAHAAKKKLHALLIVGHPGKLAKLAMGSWQTHSSRSPSAVPFVAGLIQDIGGRAPGGMTTVEGLFAALEEKDRAVLGQALATRIAVAVERRIGGVIPVATVLVDMRGDITGCHGNLSPWQ